MLLCVAKQHNGCIVQPSSRTPRRVAGRTRSAARRRRWLLPEREGRRRPLMVEHRILELRELHRHKVALQPPAQVLRIHATQTTRVSTKCAWLREEGC